MKPDRLTAQELSAIEHGLADGIAFNLGKSWEAGTLHPVSDGYSPTWVLRNADNSAVITLSIPMHIQDKLEISGLVPNSDPSNKWKHGCRASITVTHSRGPDAIAKEITRRLMPDYLPKLEKAKQTRAEVIEWRDRRDANMNILLAAFNGKPSPNSDESFCLHSKQDGYGDVQVSATTANIKLSSISISMALEIAAIWTKAE